ncbi:MAG: RNA methyltransferase [Myxococcaceae bacterium]|nr:RNA methyltransferase [Myxococcaceae bacterium]MCI0668908.1 RNA methyltransferase [Myxococcaceae bacterium]
MGPGENLTVVLHQTQSPENLGAVARVMANFGFTRLVLSEPVTQDLETAGRLAVRGEQVLEGARVCGSLGEAVEGMVYAVGTTSRSHLRGRRTLTPEEAVARLAQESARGPVALVLGGERRGLSDEDLMRCQDALVIPTSDVQPSMNLAQAATVLLYLCAREGRAAPAAIEPPGASLGLLQALEGWMRQVLLEVDFLNPRGPDAMVNELVQALQRARLSPREAELWLGAFKHLARRLVHPLVPPTNPPTNPTNDPPTNPPSPPGRGKG